MKILRASFVIHCMTNCSNSRYVPLDPSLYGQKFVENWWEPIWFEGIWFGLSPFPLPYPDYAVDEYGEVDESGMAEESGTINESEIVESEEAHFRESEEIDENYSGQEEHSDSSGYVDSCSDSNGDADIDF